MSEVRCGLCGGDFFDRVHNTVEPIVWSHGQWLKPHAFVPPTEKP